MVLPGVFTSTLPKMMQCHHVRGPKSLKANAHLLYFNTLQVVAALVHISLTTSFYKQGDYQGYTTLFFFFYSSLFHLFIKTLFIIKINLKVFLNAQTETSNSTISKFGSVI